MSFLESKAYSVGSLANLEGVVGLIYGNPMYNCENPELIFFRSRFLELRKILPRLQRRYFWIPFIFKQGTPLAMPLLV